MHRDKLRKMMLVLLAGLLAAPEQDAAAWKARGVALAARQKLEDALPAFEKACQLAPQDEEACYYLARTLYSLERWNDARQPFEKALRAAPKEKAASVHRAMALNFIGLGRHRDAEDHFRSAVQLQKGVSEQQGDARVDFGAFLFREGRTDEALGLLREAVRENNKSARAHAELGRVLLHSGAIEPAAREFERSLLLEPRAWSVRLLYGRALLELGRTEEGERELRAARDGWSKLQGSSTVR